MMTLYKIIRSMPCFFKEVTHFYCPACGGTRSVIALLHLDIERAFLCNPTVVYTGIMFLWCIAGWMVKKLTAREMKSMKPRLWMLILGVCIFFGYAVIRNILVYQFGYDYLGDLIHITQNLIKYLSQIKSAIFLLSKDGTFNDAKVKRSIACTCIRTHCIINIKKEVAYERMERIFI